MVKKAIQVLGIGMLIFALTSPVWAEKYPDRPIDFICTWGVGGGADQMARVIGKISEKTLGVPLPVSNIPGSSGNTGMANVLAAKADGYTIATYMGETLWTIPMGMARYKVTDIQWIARTQVAPSFLYVKTDSPFKTIQDLLKFAKENPRKLKVAATGFGTGDDITVRFLASKGFKMITIPIPQPGERYASTLGGHSEVLYEQAGDIKQYLEAKQLRPLIIFAQRRDPAFPDVPCSVELGYEITLPQWRSIVAKKGVPTDRVKILSDVFKKATETPEWKKFAEEQYLDPESYMGLDKFGSWVAGEMETRSKFMKTFEMIK